MAAYLLLICSALAAGLINSVAGGGSFLTFPALIFAGAPSIIANASSTLALLPGSLSSAWAYSDDFHRTEGFPRTPLFLVSLTGGIIGALLLLFTPQRTFDSAIPWLMLASTLLFALGPRISPIFRRAFRIGPATLILIQLSVGHLWRLFRRGRRNCDACYVVSIRPLGH
jgi:uncharacterized protein